MAVQKSQEQDKFIVRLPSGLRDRIRRAADANHRSMNAEIVATLRDKYPEPVPSNVREPAARILLWLAERIRRRKPQPGSARDRQANLYESVARDIINKMEDIEPTKIEMTHKR